MNNNGKKYVFGALKENNYWEEETVLTLQNGFLVSIVRWLKRIFRLK